MEKRKIYREFFKFIKIIEYKYFDRMSFRIIKYLEGYWWLISYGIESHWNLCEDFDLFLQTQFWDDTLDSITSLADVLF